jgi:hypothetical protein
VANEYVGWCDTGGAKQPMQVVHDIEARSGSNPGVTKADADPVVGTGACMFPHFGLDQGPFNRFTSHARVEYHGRGTLAGAIEIEPSPGLNLHELLRVGVCGVIDEHRAFAAGRRSCGSEQGKRQQRKESIRAQSRPQVEFEFLA